MAPLNNEDKGSMITDDRLCVFIYRSFLGSWSAFKRLSVQTYIQLQPKSVGEIRNWESLDKKKLWCMIIEKSTIAIILLCQDIPEFHNPTLPGQYDIFVSGPQLLPFQVERRTPVKPTFVRHHYFSLLELPLYRCYHLLHCFLSCGPLPDFCHHPNIPVLLWWNWKRSKR